MMTRMTGLLTRVLDDDVRLQVGPIEYQILVPDAVRRVIQLSTGTEITLHITEYLEGNAGGNRFIPRRIGFVTEAELEFFDLFCTVEKIGAKKALKAMARPVKEIADAIARQDVRWLSTLPGIGAATAEQIVTTLKRKVAKFVVPPAQSVPDGDLEPRTARGRKATAVPVAPADAASVVVDGQLIDDIYRALMGLGHSPAEARSRLDALLSSGKSFTSVQDALTLVYAQKS